MTTKDSRTVELAERREAARKFIHEALAAAENNHESAKSLLIQWLHERPDCRDALLSRTINLGMDHLLREEHKRIRQEMWDRDRALKLLDTVPIDDVTGLIALGFTNLLEYPMGDGTPLGDAVKAQVVTTTLRHRKLTRTHAIRTRWFQLIEGEMGDGTVRDTLAHGDLDRMQKQAAREIAVELGEEEPVVAEAAD